MKWFNYFVPSVHSSMFDGHLPAELLRKRIKEHDGSEAYHCAFNLEERTDFKDYVGRTRPAFGYVWFDFDSKPIDAAFEDAKAFVAWLEVGNVFICYSGSKGFHVGVPSTYFDLEHLPDCCSHLHGLAVQLKSRFKTLDTTVFHANAKFRALGSRHPKTGLFKIALGLAANFSFATMKMEEIQKLATQRGNLEIPVPEANSHLEKLKLLPATEKPSKPKSEKKEWSAPSGEEAFKQCSFLQHARNHAVSTSEPEWYAALSIVSRFKDGRKQCHSISHAHPGYSVGSCNAKIDQALAESGPRTCESISALHEGCARCPLFGKINSPVNIFEMKFYVRGAKGTLIPDYNSLLSHFKDATPYKTIADMKTVYVFKETHYEEYTPIEIKAFAEEKFEPKPQEKLRQEFYHKVCANEIARRKFFIETTSDKLNFKNGILDLRSRHAHQTQLSLDQPVSVISNSKLELHSPAIGFRGVLPYKYDESAQCQTFDWWINDVMLGDEQLIKILQEYMGYVIRGGEYKYHKALWLSGSGRNGKSTFLSVLKALIGVGNYSTLSIRQIINDKFSSADLDGKIANFSEETSPEELSDSGPFKNLTGDGELLAQKKYGDPYSFRNRAKLIMTYNEVPELRDLSPGMLSRPIIVPWKKDLTETGTQDRSLKEKLIQELPGIFNFALKGWMRLEEQNDFTFSPQSQIELEKIRDSSCSALQWVKEYLTFLPIDANSSNHQIIEPHELYEAYKSVESRFAYKAVKFFRRIAEHPEVKKRHRHTRKGKEYFSMLIKQRALHQNGVTDPN